MKRKSKTPAADPNQESPLKVIGGSDRAIFNNFIANAAIKTGWGYAETTDGQIPAVTEATIIGMIAFKPTDEIEGMIAAQAMAMHHASMECARRAMIPEQPFEVAQGYRKAAANASRGFEQRQLREVGARIIPGQRQRLGSFPRAAQARRPTNLRAVKLAYGGPELVSLLAPPRDSHGGEPIAGCQ